MVENPHSISENGLLEQGEFRKFKDRTTTSKFKHQLFLGVGGATVFGLVGAIGSTLFDIMLAGSTETVLTLFGAALTAPTLAMVGLGALAAIGLGCIYFGSQFLSESIMLDQDFQAKKIGMATRGVVPQLTPAIEQGGGKTTPPGMGLTLQNQPSEKPQTEGLPQLAISEASLQGRLEAPSQAAVRA